MIRELAINPSTPKRIADSLNTAMRMTETRNKYISKILDSYSEGFKFIFNKKIWSKFTAGGDMFWTNGKKNLTSSQLLNELGVGLVKAGVLTEKQYYG